MGREIREADWKVFRQVRTIALQRFCEGVLFEVTRLAADTGKSDHERYLAVFELIQSRDQELTKAFNDMRRSTAYRQLVVIRARGLLTDEEFVRFGPEMRAAVEALLRP